MENIYNQNDISLITKLDIDQILKITTSIWLDEGFYPTHLLISVIKDDLSFSIKNKKEIICFCLIRREGFNEGNIFLICVKEDYQHKGLGYKILNYCIDNAKKQGIRQFFLHVSINNEPAINIYKKCGFKVKKVYKNYYRSKKNPEINPAYFMILKK